MTKRLTFPTGFRILTEDRAEKGFVIQFAVGFSCDIPPFNSRDANEAGHAREPGYATINPAYFDLTDKRIEMLVDAGLVPNIVGSWGYYLETMGVENAKLHWRYLIARYGALPVTWTLAGESTLVWYGHEGRAEEKARSFQRAGWSEVGRFIKANDPYHRLLTVHPGPAPGISSRSMTCTSLISSFSNPDTPNITPCRTV